MPFFDLLLCKSSKGTLSEADILIEESRIESLLSFKLLLLGAGESGKSTILRQFKLVNKITFTQEEKKNFAINLRRNTVSSMQAILDAFGYVKNPPELNDELKECKDVVQKFSFEDEECEVPLFIQSAIEKLWNSLPVKALLERRSEFWCLDGVDYYFNNLCRFVDPNFEPEEEDCVLARIITTGIVTTGFSTPCALHRELQLKYTIIDVGGQRNERRKWIHCFDDVSVILYVVNLAGYQTVLYEDHSVNRLLESLDVFKDTLNNEIFSQTHIFLLLNKKDLFENLIRKKPLSNLFPEYEGGDDVQKALSYIENKYKSLLVKNPERMSTFVISARVKLDMKNSWYEIDSFIQDKYRHNFRDALKGREKLEKEKKRLKLTK